MSYFNNEDAGDLDAASAAGYAESVAEEQEAEGLRVIQEYGSTCGICGLTMVDPVFHDKGTFTEEGACRKCSEDFNAVQIDDYPEFPTYG